MRNARAIQWTWRALVLLVGLLGLNCRDATSPRFLAGHVALAPTFQSGSAGIVDFNRLRITLVRPPSTQVLDTIISISPTADSVDLSLSVPLTSSSEDLLLYLRLLNAAGDTVFRNTPYPQSVTVTSGTVSAPVTAPIAYVGVGYDAVAVVIGTPDTSVLFGDTLQLVATALGSVQKPIPGTPIAWRSLDSARVGIPNRAAGRVIGGTQRGIARIVAQLLTGPADTVLVTAQPVPSLITRVGGDAQTAVPGATLPLPLRVRVTAPDGLGVRVPVRFRALSPAASVSDSVVISDSLGYAQVTGVLGTAIGLQTFEASVSRIATPVTFNATAVSGTVATVTLDRKLDTIARLATLQYTATARDSLGNPVNVTIGWTSTVPTIASVDLNGLVRALAADSTKIIAAAAGHADTARLYVRALASVVAAPADTVVTAVGDSLDLRTTAYDNFGGVLTSGFTQTFTSATPTVATVNAATGRTRALGAGNGVVVVRDSVDANLRVQGTATVRVNQVVTRVSNALSIIQIGVGGRGQIAGRAFDRNGYAVSGRTFGYVTRNAKFVTVDANGTVSGVALDSTTYVVDSLLEGATVYRDSTLVKVVAAPPALLRWGVPNDSLSVGNGGSVSVPLTLSRTDSAPRTVFLSVIPAVDTLVARPATGCGGPVLQRVVIPALTSGSSVLVCGLKAGRVLIKAQDSLSVFAPDSMVVTVSTPQLQLTLSPNANVGQKYTLTVYAEDSLGTARNVTVPLSVTLVSSNPVSTVFDSATITIPAGSYYASTGVTFTLAGIYAITGSAPAYTPGTVTSSATGALVTMQSNLSFSPQSVTIKAGQYVTWRNDDAINHTTTEDSATPVWDSGQLGPGQTFQRNFGSAGIFTYHCRNHPNMTGTVTVTP